MLPSCSFSARTGAVLVARQAPHKALASIIDLDRILVAVVATIHALRLARNVVASAGAPLWYDGQDRSGTARSCLPIRICFRCPPFLIALFAQPVLNSWKRALARPMAVRSRLALTLFLLCHSL